MVSIFVICKSIFTLFEVGLSRSQCRQSLYLGLTQHILDKSPIHAVHGTKPQQYLFHLKVNIPSNGKTSIFCIISVSKSRNQID